MTTGAIHCVTCGVENPDDSAFCAECGSRLAADAGPGAPDSPPAGGPASAENLPPIPTWGSVDPATAVPAWGSAAALPPPVPPVPVSVPAWGSVETVPPPPVPPVPASVPGWGSAEPLPPLPPVPPTPPPARATSAVKVNRKVVPLLPPPVDKRELPLVARSWTGRNAALDTATSTISRNREIAYGLPEWDPLPPGETVVSRRPDA